MTRPDPLHELVGKRVLLYFSSGRPTEAQRALPYDRLVYVNPPPTRRADDRVLELPCDNNDAILRLHHAGVRVSCAVGVNDGCCEGGNYECINTATFFGRLAPILHDECRYVADHRSGVYADLFTKQWSTDGSTRAPPFADTATRSRDGRRASHHASGISRSSLQGSSGLVPSPP